MDEVKYETSSCRLSEPFRRFASMLDDEGRLLVLSKDEEEANKELMTLIGDMKRFAWRRAGVLLLSYGDIGDKTV